jgi:cytochrome c556
MLRIAAVAALVAVGATAVYAQNMNAIDARQKAMKAMSQAAKGPGGMMKGAAAFDLAKVQAALKVYQDEAGKAKGLFPADSKTGGDTEALPVIWEKKAEFEGKWDKLVADAKAAAAAIKDEASFKAEYGKVMGNCGGCHKVFRKPKS